MYKEEKEEMIEKILKVLQKDSLTITEIQKKTKGTRSAIRTALARLEGAKKINFRRVGMAKMYSLK